MKPNKFEYFDVTADIGVRTWGKNINEIFENAALAVTNLIVESKFIEKNISRDIEVHGNDLSSLLINWITELLIIRDSEGLLFSTFEVNISEDHKSLKVKAWGDIIVGINYEMDIKAITYSLFRLEKIDNNFFLQFVLDI